MTTTFTPEVLDSIHGQLAQRYDIHPFNNQAIAGILDTLDALTVGEYDANAAAAGLFALAGVLRDRQVIPMPGATMRDVVDFVADLASLTGQSLHATTHTIAEPELPVPIDPARQIPYAVVGDQPTPEQWEALHTYRTAMFLPSLDPRVLAGSLSYGHFAQRGFIVTAAMMNQAIDWWNRRAAALGAPRT